ncbi:hypothetical protein EYF80_048091 [Liparis tanakae]|uniref:Uncharacterized protein n=1 Tax=Liparis tanakae TaxID=230148 RepID=A0A4Z2FKQ6_9TELE|nr:hypothetical protein EYF80_048091 [Liparis tanakae]
MDAALTCLKNGLHDNRGHFVEPVAPAHPAIPEVPIGAVAPPELTGEYFLVEVKMMCASHSLNRASARRPSPSCRGARGLNAAAAAAASWFRSTEDLKRGRHQRGTG